MPRVSEVDWRGVTDTLYEGGYDGVVAIEYEDPVWSGPEERVGHGLEIARRTLQPLWFRDRSAVSPATRTARPLPAPSRSETCAG